MYDGNEVREKIQRRSWNKVFIRKIFNKFTQRFIKQKFEFINFHEHIFENKQYKIFNIKQAFEFAAKQVSTASIFTGKLSWTNVPGCRDVVEQTVISPTWKRDRIHVHRPNVAIMQITARQKFSGAKVREELRRKWVKRGIKQAEIFTSLNVLCAIARR